MNNFKKYLKLAKNKLMKRLLIIITVVILANLIFTPYPTLAYSGDVSKDEQAISLDYQLIADEQVKTLIKIINPEVLNWGVFGSGDSHLPENKALTVKYTINATITAYNSEVGQCDDSPCITANGFDVCKHAKEDTIAMNGMKMGTKVRFPELFGTKVFVVRDRMNARYGSNRADVWMISKADAKKFGVKFAKMEVLE